MQGYAALQKACVMASTSQDLPRRRAVSRCVSSTLTSYCFLSTEDVGLQRRLEHSIFDRMGQGGKLKLAKRTLGSG